MIDRYSVPEMTAIWSDESRFSRWLSIEILAVEARVLAGEVPQGDLDLIRAGARFDPARIAGGSSGGSAAAVAAHLCAAATGSDTARASALGKRLMIISS